VIEFRDSYQEQLYNKVREFINSNNSSLLVSGPPGSGKTFITIHSLLDNFDGKIIVILRTHSQQDHYKKLFQDDFLSIRGIEYHCQIQQVKLHPLRNQLCKWMRLGKHIICQGCRYRLQFMEIPKYKVISFLYSHSAELIKSILENLNDDYILVFDEYHHILPREQTISKHFIQLAGAEYGSEINIWRLPKIVEELSEMKRIGERNWKKMGYSYLLQLTETIEYLKNNGRWFYKAGEEYGYLDDSIYSLVNNDIKKIFISATPLPEIEGLLGYDDIVNMTPRMNALFTVYTGFRFSYKDRGDEKIVKHIRKLLHRLGKYRTVIFFPSYSALKTVYPKLPENFTINPDEFPEKNTLLIAGGRYGEGIDLPSDIEVLTVIGIPYDDPLFRNPYLRELYRYFKLHDVKVRKLLYDYRALLKIIQSFGRGIRDVRQRLLIVLADKRYSYDKWIELFPEWLRNNIDRFEFFNEIDELDEFISRALLFNSEDALQWLKEYRRWKDYNEKYQAPHNSSEGFSS